MAAADADGGCTSDAIVRRTLPSSQTRQAMHVPLLRRAVDAPDEVKPFCSPAPREVQAGSFMATMDPFSRAPSEMPITTEQAGSQMFGDSPSKAHRRLTATFADIGSSGSWMSAVGVSIPLVLMSYSCCVSYAQLITTGSPVSANIVTEMHLFSCGLTGLVLPLLSNCPLVIPSADISVTLFYATIVQDIVRSAARVVEGGLTQETVAATATLALPFNTILLSAVFYWVGSKKATVAVSYLPYPVVAGFLGSIGFAIFAGSFAILSTTGAVVAIPAGLPELASEVPWQLLCAIAMALSSLLLRVCRFSAQFIAIAPLGVALASFWLSAFSGSRGPALLGSVDGAEADGSALALTVSTSVDLPGVGHGVDLVPHIAHRGDRRLHRHRARCGRGGEGHRR